MGVAKDGLSGAQVVGDGLEASGVGAPAGMAINIVAGGLDQVRENAFEGKSTDDALLSFGISTAVDVVFSKLGDAAKGTVSAESAGKAVKDVHDKVVDSYALGFSKLFQWVGETIQGNEKKNDK